MKINLPRITQPLPLADYLPEAEGQVMHVWVNPPLMVLARLAALERAAKESPDKEAAGQALMGWYAECWSQHPDAATHWTLEEMGALVMGNPDFYVWVVRRTLSMIAAYEAEAKKASPAPS